MPELDFAGLTIRYDHRLLQPRPWTVAQSAWAAELLDDLPEGPVLELCAGAGQIGLCTVWGSDRRLVCVDDNPVACGYALANAEAAGLAGQVSVRELPLESAVGESELFALVIADPPWVPHEEIGRFPDDPPHAIDGGPDGLAVARACLQVARGHLLPGGALLLQLGPGQAARLSLELDGLSLVEVRGHQDRGELALLQPAERTVAA